jgi:DNA processing protein
MTRDQAVALSLLEDLPRVGLTQRLLCDDPELLERAGRGLAEAQDVRERAAASGIRVTPWNAPEYPPSLLTLPDCPPALWYLGSLTCLAAPSVAIVGSRAATSVALEAASRIASSLAALGITVVSGLARGVDSAAHRGALRGGCTLAVLGSGPDRVYPAEHRSLAADIAGRGAVISEYPPGTPPLPFHFPMRNRLISGLSSAVVVIEAAEDSGSLITAACALDQGREVMAVPGNVLTGRNRGGHALIRDGATIVECAADVTTALGWPAEGWPQPAGLGADGPSQFESDVSGDLVLAHMAPGEPCDLDTLAAASSLGAAELIPRLVALEMSGLVRRLDGGRFVRR